MSAPVSRLPCYLVEWYRPDLTDEQLVTTAAALEGCAASMSAEGLPVRLLMTLSVPTDDVIFGVFVAASAQIVAAACQRGGIPAQRLTAAVEARTEQTCHRETPDSSSTFGP
jgi:hypothetical protein